MKKIKTAFMAIVTALAMTLAAVSPANAATAGSCYVSSTARLSVTKWVLYYDSVGNPRWRYHLDINSGGLGVNGLYFRGIKQPTWNDVYVDTWNSPSTVSGIWYTGGFEESNQYKCSVVV